MKIELDDKDLNLIIDSLKRNREYYKDRLKEEHTYYDEFLSDKIYRIDKLLEKFGDMSLDFIY